MNENKTDVRPLPIYRLKPSCETSITLFLAEPK
jgi:hypothetical protein